MPIFLLALVEIALFFTNYTPGTYLIGWDNVMPELNFKLNLWRNLFAVWQEYRGLGLLDGMSHAANLVHTLFLWLLSFIFAQNLLRYMFTFLMHGLGGVGMYLLLIKILPEKKRPTIATIGALFYLFNAFTVQMFYTPLEAFSVHFAALPWLAFAFLRYIRHGNRKQLLFFLIISFLATPQFFVTPLLLPILLMFLSISMVHKKQWRRIAVCATGFLCVNAFWLLPYLYSIPRIGPVIQSAKINQMSSNEIFLKNQAFGDAQSILLFRGFGLNLTDRLKDGSYGWLMAVWRDHLYSPITMTLYSGFFVVVLVGLTQSLVIAPFIMLFGIGFFMLGNDIPLLRDIHALLRTYVPFFGEAFRFTFTKFSLLYAFSYTILFANGLRILSTKKGGTIVVLLACTGIFYTSWPSFTGEFIYRNLHVGLPNEYQELMSFMQKQNPNGRTAMLPQPEYWSWKYYSWRLRGSGFLWYGLSQPIMDRAFDPWSANSENYYWELSRALYSKDAVALDAVFAKYAIQYVLLDENIISPSNDRSLYIDETKALLAQIPTIQVARSFGNITVYERTDETEKSFVSLKANLPTVSPVYNWTDNDMAYQNLGDYIADSSCHVSGVTCHVFPFRSLFTKRSIDEREFTITETNTMLTIGDASQATTAGIVKRDALVFEATHSAILNPQAVVPCGISSKGTAQASTIGSSAASDSGNQTIKPDQFLRFTSQNQRGCLSFDASQLSHKDGYLVAVESRHVTGRPLLLAFISDTAKHVEMEVYLDQTNSKKVKPFSLDKKGLTFSGQWQTDYFILLPLAPDGLGYTVYVSNDAIGNQETVNDIKSIKFYRFPYQDLISLRLQPQGQALSVNMNQNVIVSHPNPAYYKISLQPAAVSLEARDKSNQPEQTTLVLSQSFDPGWLAYEVETCDTKYVTGNALLSFLSRVTCRVSRIAPFLFGTQIKDHVLVNNWSNGWRLQLSAISCQPSANNNKLQAESCPLTAVLFFWPQLLEWIGFLLLPVPFIVLFLLNVFRPTLTIQST